MLMNVFRFDNYEKMCGEAASFIEKKIKLSMNQYGISTMGLSGGSSPWGVYRELTNKKINWKKVYIFFVDERYITNTSIHSNFNMIKENLINHIRIPSENIFPVPTDGKSAEEDALKYENEIRSFFKGRAKTNVAIFDILVLGMGMDGHTASIFPESEVLCNTKDYIVKSTAPEEYDVRERITMTLPLINNSREKIFIIAGKNKAARLQSVIKGKETSPAGLVIKDSSIFTNSY